MDSSKDDLNLSILVLVFKILCHKMKRRTTYHQTYFHFAKTCQGQVAVVVVVVGVCRYERQAFEWPVWM